jgi:Kdo2-lipid IVA lauroyltransferase/acyltransferase
VTRSRDLRTGGSWSAAQRAKNALIRTFVLAALAIADRLPASLLGWLGVGLGQLAHLLAIGLRRTARRNFERCLPELDARAATRACFRNAGRNLALCTLLRRPKMRVLDWVSVDERARAILDSALAKQRGVVFVSAHLGPFEWVAGAIAELGYAASIVVRESYDPALDPIVDAHRLLRGLHVIHRGKRGAPLAILRALRGGHALGLLPDVGGRVPSVDGVLLGARVAAPVGPARLARAAGCPIVVGTLEPEARRAPLRFRLRIEPLAVADSDDATTQRVMNALTAAILRAPEHWLWMARPLDLRQIVGFAEKSRPALDSRARLPADAGRAVTEP